MQQSPLNRVRQYFSSPVDGGSLAAFRIGFGALTAWMIYGFLRTEGDGPSGLSFLFTPPETTWTFPYFGLSLVTPPAEPWTTVMFVVCFVSACLVSLGLLYRLASIVLCLTYWHIVLMDATLFGNHFPLVGVFAVLLVLIPAHRRYSLDRLIVAGFWRRRVPTTLSFWCVFLVRAQTFLIYFYGGVSKLHDDWLRAQPLKMWLSPTGLYPFFGDKLSEENFTRLSDFLSQEYVAYFFSYGGLIFDLTIGFLLVFRRTRWLAFALATGFHVFNYFVIQRVGLVAPIAFWATLMFFEPDWPTRLWDFIRRPRFAKPDLGWLIAGAIAVPGVGALLGWKAKPYAPPAASSSASKLGWPVFAIGAAWLVFQTLFPARHFVIHDDPYWTERGVRFSWFLMTRNKVGGFARIRVEDPGLVRTDADGQQEFAWENYQGELPPVVYHDVDARTVTWSDLPEFFVTFEPMIGERIFFNPMAAGLVKSAEIEEHVQKYWRRTYGRSCEVFPTFPLRRQLRSVRRNAAIALQDEEPGARHYLHVVLQADERAKELMASDLNEDAFYQRFFAFKESLFAFQRLGPFYEPLARLLLQVSPFALQGNPASGLRPMLVYDPELMLSAPYVFQRLDREQWQGEATAHADFNLIPWQFMMGLPRVLPAYRQAESPWFVWNYGRELNAHQIEAMELMPMVVHSYAQHVAELWEAEQGRRPRVFGTTFVILNDRRMQKIVDPSVDLAAAAYSLFGENPWILPTPPPPVVESKAEEEGPEASPATSGR